MDSQLFFFLGGGGGGRGGIRGEAELVLGICGAKVNYFQVAEDFCRDLGEINALFLGSDGAHTPSPRGPLYLLNSLFLIITLSYR